MCPVSSRPAPLLHGLLACAGIAIASVACSGESTAWEAAARENTRPAFERYLNTYPNGRFAREARAELEWLDVSTSGSLRQLIDCERRNPDGKHGAEARARATQKAEAVSESDKAPESELRAALEVRPDDPFLLCNLAFSYGTSADKLRLYIRAFAQAGELRTASGLIEHRVVWGATGPSTTDIARATRGTSGPLLSQLIEYNLCRLSRNCAKSGWNAAVEQKTLAELDHDK